MGYFRHLLAHRHAVTLPQEVYQRPEAFLAPDWEAIAPILAASAAQETAELAPDSPRFRMLRGLWTRAELHSIATGWLAAQAGQGPEEFQ